VNDKKWWFVFNPYDSKCPTVRHGTFESAQVECKHVCELTGNEVHVLECVGTFYPPCGPIWKVRQ